MLKKGVTLRGLEVFEALAQTGSVAQAAQRTDLSQPAVSQQLRNLEAALGAELIDHSRRPMRLTPAGDLFLRRAREALSQLRQAQSEVRVMDLADLDALHLGIIDDFDHDLSPRLATILAESLTDCRFRLITAGSFELAEAVRDKTLHMAISARVPEMETGMQVHPLARDPFILVTPQEAETDTEALLAGDGDLPFLRYAAEQLIARQIDDLLARDGRALPARFEIGSHPALMAMVAQGIGWTITTPMGFMRAEWLHGQLAAHPLPLPPAAREIALVAAKDWSGSAPAEIAETCRRLIQAQMIAPALARLPWLADSFGLIDPA